MHDLESKRATRWTTFTVHFPPCMALHIRMKGSRMSTETGDYSKLLLLIVLGGSGPCPALQVLTHACMHVGSA